MRVCACELIANPHVCIHICFINPRLPTSKPKSDYYFVFTIRTVNRADDDECRLPDRTGDKIAHTRSRYPRIHTHAHLPRMCTYTDKCITSSDVAGAGAGAAASTQPQQQHRRSNHHPGRKPIIFNHNLTGSRLPVASDSGHADPQSNDEQLTSSGRRRGQRFGSMSLSWSPQSSSSWTLSLMAVAVAVTLILAGAMPVGEYWAMGRFTILYRFHVRAGSTNSAIRINRICD